MLLPSPYISLQNSGYTADYTLSGRLRLATHVIRKKNSLKTITDIIFENYVTGLLFFYVLRTKTTTGK